MATLTIPDELDARLERAATERGCSKDEMVLDVLEHSADDSDELQVTPELVALLRHRLDEARKGEFVSFEAVEAKLLAFIAERNVQ